MADEHRARARRERVDRRLPRPRQGVLERLHARDRRPERVLAPGGERGAEALARAPGGRGPRTGRSRPRSGAARRSAGAPVASAMTAAVSRARDERAREHGVDLGPRRRERAGGSPGLVAPEGGQRHVDLAGVDVAGRTLGLSVANDVEPRARCRGRSFHRPGIVTVRRSSCTGPLPSGGPAIALALAAGAVSLGPWTGSRDGRGAVVVRRPGGRPAWSRKPAGRRSVVSHPSERIDARGT